MRVKDSLFTLSKYWMIPCGLWKLSSSKNIIIQRIYLIFSYFVRAMFTMITMAMTIKGILIIAAVNETDKIFGTITTLMIYLDMALRLFLFHSNRIPQMFVDIIREENNIQITQNKRIKAVYLSQCKNYINTSTLQIVSTVAAAYFYIVLNLFLFEMTSPSFMYEMWIPFSINWKIVSGIKIFLCQFGVLINVATHIGLQSLTIFVATQLKILHINLDESFKTNIVNNDVEVKLGRIIERHQYIIEFVKNLNNSVKSIILMEYVLDSVNLAAGMSQIVTAQSIIELVFSLVYLFLLVLQLFLLAWTANEINIQSYNVSNAVYESNWMDQSASVKKNMLIMIMRAQKPLSLTIGPFGQMNLRAGITTMKGAYTYAGVMRQTYT